MASTPPRVRSETSITCRRDARSPTSPPATTRSTCGSREAASTSPSAATDPVTCRTANASATAVRALPNDDAPTPSAYRATLRSRRTPSRADRLTTTPPPLPVPGRRPTAPVWDARGRRRERGSVGATVARRRGPRGRRSARARPSAILRSIVAFRERLRIADRLGRRSRPLPPGPGLGVAGPPTGAPEALVTAEPASPDRPGPAPPTGPLLDERYALAARFDELRRDLAGLLVEMGRRGRFNHELLERRAREAAAVEARIAELDGSLAGQAAFERTGRRLRRGDAPPSGMRICPTCRAAVPADANFCAYCGTTLAA